MNFLSPSPMRRTLGVPSSLLILGACLLALSLGAARLSAQTNIVTNGSFENQTLANWSAMAGTRAFSFFGNASNNDGSDGHYALAFGGGGAGASGMISQWINTTIGTTYTLSFDARYFGGFDAGTGLTYAIRSYPTSSLYASGTLTTGTEITAAGYNAATGPTMNWNHFSYTFTATSTMAMIQFADATSASAGAGADIQLDNISVTASAVPEPSTYAAFAGLGALGLVALRRRRAAAL